MDWRPGDCLFLEGNAQLPRVRANLLQERPRRRRGPIGITGCGAARGVEECGTVSYGPRQGVAASKAAPAFADVGTGRIAPAGRLQAKQAAMSGGDTDGSAAVGPVRGRHHVGRDSSSGAAAGAAGTTFKVPGIASRTVCHGLGGRVEAELRRVGATEHDEAGGL